MDEATIAVKVAETEFNYTSLVNVVIDKYSDKIMLLRKWGYPLSSLLRIISINPQLMNNMVLVCVLMPDLSIDRKEVPLNATSYG